MTQKPANGRAIPNDARYAECFFDTENDARLRTSHAAGGERNRLQATTPAVAVEARLAIDKATSDVRSKPVNMLYYGAAA